MGLSIADIFGGSVVSGIKDLIGQFHASPEDKLKMQEMVDANAATIATAQIAYDEKLNDIAGQNIRTETSSNDGFVRRARPAFLWIISTAIGFNILLPLFSQLFGGHLQPIPIDAGYISLFSTAFLGYTAARSYEKKQGVA